MSEKTESVKALIESLTPSELQSLHAYLRSKLPKHPLEEKWDITYELVLDAINRAQDITQRGVRGVIAEAVFEAKVLPTITGWRKVPVLGDLPYDFKIQQDSGKHEIKIQVKLQRTEKGNPLRQKRFGPDTFIVEVQKTRSGTMRKRKREGKGQGQGKEDAIASEPAREETRPYQFGDFDIIAVNMQPSTHDWTRFMYTVGSWLIPRASNRKLIQIMQPVHSTRSDVWTDNIEECVRWLLSAEKKSVFDLKRRTRRRPSKRKPRRAKPK